VQPTGGVPAQPKNTSLIQVGFTYNLNYNFVVNTSGSANQIMDVLPAGLAYGLNIDEEEVLSYGLRPYDTNDFITTLAMAYIPTSLVTQLSLDLHNKYAPIHNNPNATVAKLMSFINPAIAILPGQSTASTGNTGSYNGQGTSTNEQSDAGPIGGASSQSSSVKGSSVGIGMGAVAGAAVYAAAMVYIARRYRRKKQLHRHGRTSSVPTAEYQPAMSQRSSGGMGGGYFMSGARGPLSATRNSSGGRGSRNSAGSSRGARSVREAGISHPVMAENSLGWD